MLATQVRIERWEQPNALDDERDAWLKNGLISGMPSLRMAELFACRAQLFRDVDFLVVAVHTVDDVPLAVLGARWHTTAAGLAFLHIGVQFVAESAQGGDVFRLSWRELLAAVVESGRFPTLTALKTFNPIAYCAMRAYGRLPGAVMYPEIERAARDSAIDAIAKQVAWDLAPNHVFDAVTGAIKGIGTPQDLYHERPTCDDESVNDYFATHLEPGDRLLSLVQIRDPRTQYAIQRQFEAGAAHNPSTDGWRSS